MSIRHYPRNVQSRNDNIARPTATVKGAGKHGPRSVATAHDGFLGVRPDTNTTAVASTLWGY
jgi:hypothetical protein